MGGSTIAHETASCPSVQNSSAISVQFTSATDILSTRNEVPSAEARLSQL